MRSDAWWFESQATTQQPHDDDEKTDRLRERGEEGGRGYEAGKRTAVSTGTLGLQRFQLGVLEGRTLAEVRSQEAVELGVVSLLIVV